ncbi:hypothetical protein [Agromyces salentinus]|uniref:Uncharacterized protein n=1 Tax=Agromyces salentinus TaxID=269421 RepID=A0ABN2MUI5_9MICO|nr:hypothetical protein [Agromyces salentinus]
MTKLVRLSGRRDLRLETWLSTVCSRSNLQNVFNPSIATFHGDTFISFRAVPPSGGRVRAYLVSGSAEDWELVDISDEAQQQGAPFIADPKFVELNGSLYATFNTGYSATANNAIYLMRIAPTRGLIQECVVSPRQRVEKNWAFYIGPNGALMALYSLSPVAVIKCVAGSLEDDRRQLHFDYGFSGSPSTASRKLTIGTQLLVEGTTGLLIAHRKFHVGPKRAYLGRVARVDLRSSEHDLTLGTKLLIDSFGQFVSPTKKLNPNLLSATYFSGLARTCDGLLLGYGINDAESRFAHLTEGELW